MPSGKGTWELEEWGGKKPFHYIVFKNYLETNSTPKTYIEKTERKYTEMLTLGNINVDIFLSAFFVSNLL